MAIWLLPPFPLPPKVGPKLACPSQAHRATSKASSPHRSGLSNVTLPPASHLDCSVKKKVAGDGRHSSSLGFVSCFDSAPMEQSRGLPFFQPLTSL